MKDLKIFDENGKMIEISDVINYIFDYAYDKYDIDEFYSEFQIVRNQDKKIHLQKATSVSYEPDHIDDLEIIN